MTGRAPAEPNGRDSSTTGAAPPGLNSRVRTEPPAAAKPVAGQQNPGAASHEEAKEEAGFKRQEPQISLEGGSHAGVALGHARAHGAAKAKLMDRLMDTDAVSAVKMLNPSHCIILHYAYNPRPSWPQKATQAAERALS